MREEKSRDKLHAVGNVEAGEDALIGPGALDAKQAGSHYSRDLVNGKSNMSTRVAALNGIRDQIS